MTEKVELRALGLGKVNKNKLINFFNMKRTEFVMILSEKDDQNQRFQILVKEAQAESIAYIIQRDKTPNQLITQELFKSVLDQLDCKLESVFINKMDDKKILQCVLTFLHGQKAMEFNASVADSIALSLLYKCKIFVDKEIFDKCKYVPKIQPQFKITE